MKADAVPVPDSPRADGLPRGSDLPSPPLRAHLVGAGGAGMRALALLLSDAGYEVDGCDRSPDARSPEIARAGGALAAGHDPGHVEGAGLVIRSSAVPEDHPEIDAAREAGVPVWRRAGALAALVNDRTVVGISGTHGKTTITAMSTLALRSAGVDAAGVVGGRVPGWDGNAVSGDGPVVVEADEYDGSFLELDPALAVVSSLEAEHMESYATVGELEEAFAAFAERAVPRLGVLYCADDPGARALGRRLEGRGYGFHEDAAYRVEPGEAPGSDAERGTPARLVAPEASLAFRVAAPGRHNLQNAAGALAVALLLGADPDRAADALAAFPGVDRRLQTLVDRGGLSVVDDYAHHPTEVRASLAAVGDRWPDRRLVAVFQPHLFSRTRRFAAEFAAALEPADEVLVLPIYPAREAPIPGVSSSLVVEAGSDFRAVDRSDVRDRVREARGGTVLLFMGAGDVTELAREAAREVGDRALDT